MALVKDNGGTGGGNRIFVTLVGGEHAGFRQKLGMSTPTDGSDPVQQTATYPAVTGVPVAFGTREVLTYAARLKMREANPSIDFKTLDLSKLDDDQVESVAYLNLKDKDTGEVVSVSFDVHSREGGKIIGALNAARLAGALGEDMKLKAFFAEPGSKYTRSAKGETVLSLGPNVEGAQNYRPVFTGADGQPLLNAQDVKDGAGNVVAAAGSHASLPFGEEHTVGKKKIWDFTARDEVISQTALSVLDAFKDAPTDNDSVNYADAASAAAPKG